LALILWGGINYYSGQLFDMKAITEAGHDVGAKVGFDLAHAVGNVPLALHNWDVDFACWCSYKYLNAGPGGIGGAYIHERYHTEKSIPRFGGWWGSDKATRFLMQKGFAPSTSAEGWQLSTPSPLLYASHKAALEVFEEAGWQKLQMKGKQMNNFLWFLLQGLNTGTGQKIIEFITPSNESERGLQVSMHMLSHGKKIFDELTKAGVIIDWREPNVIRLAPVPLYNSFEEIWQFTNILRTILEQLS
jgi:kynureninase